MNHPYPPIAAQSCQGCRYSSIYRMASSGESQYLCRRRPPLHGYRKADDLDGEFWPMVFFDDWCGEWAPQEVAQ